MNIPAQTSWVRPKQPSIGMLDFHVEVDEAPDDVGLLLAGRYELRRLIGSGATALVYEAVDQKTDRTVAVKVLMPAARAQVGGFFAQEGRLAARVRSPHLIQASDFGEDQDRLYIVFAHLPGRSLSQLMHGRVLPWREIGHVALHVLDALASLHGRSVVHRDVKPDNIIVSEVVTGLHATLLDLGFAAVLPEGVPEPTRSVFGTAGFIAPEIFGGLAPDPRSDLYSLGAVLYLALTGQPVPDYRTFPEIVLPSPRVFLPEIPAPMAALVLRALSDIDARFPTAEAMAAELAHALRDSGAALVAPAPPRPAEPAPPALAVPHSNTTSVDERAKRNVPVFGRASRRGLLLGSAFVCATLALRADEPQDSGVPAVIPCNSPPPEAAPTGPDSSTQAAINAPARPVQLPAVAEVLEDVQDPLRKCALDGLPFSVELSAAAGEDRFREIRVEGDEATRLCARRVLDAARFEPGAALRLTQEYGP